MALSKSDSIECDISSSKTEGNVVQFQTLLGTVYKIRAHSLPFLEGNLYLFPFQFDNRHSSERRWILIDAGNNTNECLNDIERAFVIIRKCFDSSFEPHKIEQILLTHAHIDHFGGAYELKRQTNAEVCIHTFEKRLTTAYDECAVLENQHYELFLRKSGVESDKIQPILYGFGFCPGRAKSIESVRSLWGNEQIGDLRPLYLPGHSSGHLAFLYGNVIFSGDLLLSKTLTQIWPSYLIPQTGILNYIWSLKKLERLALDFERRYQRKLIAFTAHEEIVWDIPKRIGEVFYGMERRNQKLLGLLREAKSPLTLNEITSQMYWSGRPNREFFALSDVGSRVEFLLQLGLIQITDVDKISHTNPVLHYSLSFTDTESTKNTIEQIFGMDFSCYETDTSKRYSDI